MLSDSFCKVWSKPVAKPQVTTPAPAGYFIFGIIYRESPPLDSDTEKVWLWNLTVTEKVHL